MDENPFQDREFVKVDLDKIGEQVKLRKEQIKRMPSFGGYLGWNINRIGLDEKQLVKMIKWQKQRKLGKN